MKVTVVDGTTYTGLFAADGSINVVLDDSTYKGLYHPCGAFRVKSAPGSGYAGLYAPDGAWYAQISNTGNGAWVVEGLTEGGGDPPDEPVETSVLTLTSPDTAYAGTNTGTITTQRTWASGAGYNRVYSDTFKSRADTQGYLIEVDVAAVGGDAQFGFVGGQFEATSWLGSGGYECGVFFSEGNLYQGGSVKGALVSFAAGDKLQFAIKGGKVWMRKKTGTTVSDWDNSGTADPSTDAGGALTDTNLDKFYLCLQGSSTAINATVHFLSTGEFTTPSGFIYWDE